MFLRNLSNENKEKFWKLANFIISADGELQENELKILSEYENEMEYIGVEKIISLEAAKEILDSLDKNDMKQIKIMYMELLALAYSDDDYSSEEEEFLELYRKKFNIDINEVKKLEESIKKLMEIYKNISEFINF